MGVRARRLGGLLTASAAAGLALSACSGSSEASTKDFCASYEVVQKAGDDQSDIAKEVAEVQDAYTAFEAVGMPADMPNDARDGFIVLGDVVSSVSQEASQADLDQLDEQVQDGDRDKVEAFFSYVATTC